jgi:hypothetical protein
MKKEAFFMLDFLFASTLTENLPQNSLHCNLSMFSSIVALLAAVKLRQNLLVTASQADFGMILQDHGEASCMHFLSKNRSCRSLKDFQNYNM